MYDRRNPPSTENFNPAEANPEFNITCVGDHSNIQLPIVNRMMPTEFDPNEFSMQQLCAKPQYGGGERFQHIGGYCLPQTRGHGLIAFDRSPEAATCLLLSNPRVQLECRTRCQCNALANPRPVTVYNPRPGKHNYEIDLDIVRDFQIAAIDHYFGIRREEVLSTRVLYDLSQVKAQLGNAGKPVSHLYPFTPLFVSVDISKTNLVLCKGSLSLSDASWLGWRQEWGSMRQLAGGGSRISNQKLCAVALSRGNPSANAGAFCHRTYPWPSGSDTDRFLSFSDEMTPLLSWTFRENFFFSAAVRLHCWRACDCATGNKYGNPNGTNPAEKWWWMVYNLPQGLLPFVQREPPLPKPIGEPDYVSDGGDEVRHQAYEKGRSDPGAGLKEFASNCAHDPGHPCLLPWPTEMFGRTPKVYQDALDAASGAPTSDEVEAIAPNTRPISNLPAEVVQKQTANLTQCGSYCTTVQDCRSGGEDDNCVCRDPTSQEVKLYGVDPVFPKAMCLGIS